MYHGIGCCCWGRALLICWKDCGIKGFLSHLSTCLVEVVPYLQDKLYLHQLENESSLGRTCSLCTLNKSSISTLMNKKKKSVFWKINAVMCPISVPCPSHRGCLECCGDELLHFPLFCTGSILPQNKVYLIEGSPLAQGASTCSMMHLNVGGLEITECTSGYLQWSESC